MVGPLYADGRGSASSNPGEEQETGLTDPHVSRFELAFDGKRSSASSGLLADVPCKAVSGPEGGIAWVSTAGHTAAGGACLMATEP